MGRVRNIGKLQQGSAGICTFFIGSRTYGRPDGIARRIVFIAQLGKRLQKKGAVFAAPFGWFTR
jgi:hypothetical protein